jgi:3-methyladenine DNA glycosylase AlkD
MEPLNTIKRELAGAANAEKAKSMEKYFQAKPGGYGEGDTFLGITVPKQREIAKKHYKQIRIAEIMEMLKQPIHEYRLTAIFMLVLKFQKAKDAQLKNEIEQLYLKHLNYVNNWDLVDSSAHHILGPQLMHKDKELLYTLANDNNLWKQRVAIIATLHFIREQHFDDTLRIAEMLLNHKHDLIHKAVGWMLREVGNKNFDVEYQFLAKHYKQMPRTMLRYAIEKFPEDLRQKFLKGLVE